MSEIRSVRDNAMRLLMHVSSRMRGIGSSIGSIWIHFPAASLYAARQKSILKWRRRVRPRSEKPRRMKPTRKMREIRGMVVDERHHQGIADLFATQLQRGLLCTSPPRLNLYSFDEYPVDRSRRIILLSFF